MKVKALFWDIHGVLYDADFDLVHREFGRRLGINPETMAGIIDEHLPGIMRGKYRISDLALELRERFGVNADLGPVFADATRMYATVHPEILRLIDDLRASIKEVAFSNLGDLRNVFDRQINLYAHFEEVVLSFEEGHAKPEAEFYMLACKRVGVTPEEVVLIDDNQDNIDGAAAVGMRGILNRDALDVRHELKTVFGVS